jgi:hypothetical protein
MLKLLPPKFKALVVPDELDTVPFKVYFSFFSTCGSPTLWIGLYGSASCLANPCSAMSPLPHLEVK